MAYPSEVLARTVEMMLNSCPQLSLSKIAFELGVDRHTLERALLRTRRKVFRELRAEILASKAAVLLGRVPPLSVKEVAFMLGYESPRSFSRFVKQRLGASPSALRSVQRELPPQSPQMRQPVA